MDRIAVLMLVASIALPLSAQMPDRIVAQQLVEEALAKHPEMATLVMHVTPPDGSDNIIIASNIGRIGKKADADDMRVIETGQPNLEANKAGDRFGVELVFQDSSGTTIGALAVGFPYKSGDDTSVLQKKAEQIRDELRSRIPTRAKLFEPAHPVSPDISSVERGVFRCNT